VKRDGLDSLSMRRLAEELDAGTMTVYGYFRGKDELLDALVDLSSARSKGLQELGDGPWRQQLRRLALAVRETLAENPWEVELRMRRPLVSPGAMRVPEAGLQILQSAGFPPAEAARAFRTLFLYTFGFSGFGDPADPERVVRETVAQVAPLPADEYPAVSAAIDELSATMAGEEQYEFGLDLILDGLEARLG
jgi:AcrR family transcriptional regulator